MLKVNGRQDFPDAVECGDLQHDDRRARCDMCCASEGASCINLGQELPQAVGGSPQSNLRHLEALYVNPLRLQLIGLSLEL